MAVKAIKQLIGIDAGGTKTIARLIDLSTDSRNTAISGPGSLTNDTDTACQTIRKLALDLLTKSDHPAANTVLVCGAAGAENQGNTERLSSILADIKLAEVVITTDAYISLMGATGGKPGVVVALGTGSVALRMDHSGKITQYGGWGFRVGDQGSGAHMGRALVIEVLKAFDKGTTDVATVARTLAVIGTDRQSILQWVKSASARDFASLCSIVFAEREHDPISEKLHNNLLHDSNDLIDLARGSSQLPVYLTGGLGKILLPHLAKKAGNWLSLATGDALDGALLVGRQTVDFLEAP